MQAVPQKGKRKLLTLISREEKCPNFSSRQSHKSAQNYREERREEGTNPRTNGERKRGREGRITITILLNNNRRFLPSFLPSFLPVSLEKKRVGVDLNFNGGGERGASIRILFVPHSKVVIAASQQIWTAAAAVATENMIRPSKGAAYCRRHECKRRFKKRREGGRTFYPSPSKKNESLEATEKAAIWRSPLRASHM